MMKSCNLKLMRRNFPAAKRPPTLGVRNCNPLNIRFVPSNHWLGLSETTPNVMGFCCFRHMDYGFRAAIILLLNYYRKYGCTTPEKIIYRWAPPSENDTELYIACVCGRAGVERHQELDTNAGHFDRLVAAMARQESGVMVCDARIRALRKKFGLVDE